MKNRRAEDPILGDYQDCFTKIAEFIRQNDDFLVVSHSYPDGDAVGSVIAFGHILHAFEKNFTLALDGGVPERYAFLPGADKILDPAVTTLNKKFSRLITLDIGTYRRIGKVESLLSDKPAIVNIDHHSSNDGFGEIACIDIETSAVCEILYHFIIYLKIEIHQELAELLYTGILTDTGRFRFSNTTPSCLRVSADLLECGIDPTYIAEKVYFNLPLNQVKVMGGAIANLEVLNEGRFVLMEYSDAKENIDTEGFADFAIGIKGVQVAAFIRRFPDDERFKVSLRGRNGFNVLEVAGDFGGGGHFSAAGFRFRGSLETLRVKLIDNIISRLRQHGTTAGRTGS